MNPAGCATRIPARKRNVYAHIRKVLTARRQFCRWNTNVESGVRLMSRRRTYRRLCRRSPYKNETFAARRRRDSFVRTPDPRLRRANTASARDRHDRAVEFTRARGQVDVVARRSRDASNYRPNTPPIDTPNMTAFPPPSVKCTYRPSTRKASELVTANR